MKRALIVDDLIENLYLLESLLKSYGYQITAANNGAEALGLALKEPPDIIIADIMMPVMDGYTLCREWKKEETLKNIPFVFYTATYTHPKDQEFALNLGADKFIIKPQEPEIFIAIIEQVLSEYKADKPIVRQPAESSDMIILKEYNETLIRKMEDRMLKSEEAEKKIRIYATQLEQEIENRKQVEEALKESEKLYRQLFDNSLDGVLLTIPNGGILQANAAACAMFGKTEDQIVQLGRQGIIDIKDPRLEIALEERSRYGKFAGELTGLRNDGTHFSIEISSAVFKNHEGFDRTSMIIRDITERKEAESELRFHSEILQNLSEGVNLVSARDGMILYTNPRFDQMFGYNTGELTGKHVSIINAPDDKSPGIKADEIMSQLSHACLWTGQILNVRKDGSIFWCRANVTPYKHPQFGDVWLTIQEDITESKYAEDAVRESEEKYRRIFENVQDVYYETTIEGTILEVSPSIGILSKGGYHRDDLIGKSMYDFYSITGSRSTFISMLSERGIVTDYEINLKNRDGSIVPCSISTKIQLDDNGLPLKVIGSMRDITERKQTEKELINAKNKAEESDRLKSAFLANMSHEVRTPLNSIIGFSELLVDPDFGEEEKGDFIKHIISNGRSLLSVISDIMDISKIESGEITIRKSLENAQKFISNIKEQFTLQAIEKKLELSLNLPADVEETEFYTDQERLRQIFGNLMSNAIKFTEKGCVEIGFQIKDKMVEFYVKDTGIGISAEYHDKIFERFRQVEAEKTRKYGGNGLGLAITKNLVELMGGKIWIESEIGKGSMFYFTIPCMVGPEANNVI